MKKAAVILLLVLLTAAFALPGSADMNKYSTVFMDTFDTVISLIGYAENQETFNARAAETHAMYLHLHKMFDTYNSYADEGIVSVYDVNLKAASEPVRAAARLPPRRLPRRRFRQREKRLSVRDRDRICTWGHAHPRRPRACT